ncbi:hypothetical protein GGR52DRAFT_138071 [Hypoxylon sp. FL1284]|nr:hypothetical protein GGR52DRAFT_138071 [Hypoxylon sp. FL1284]
MTALGLCAREVWNDVCGCGSGWAVPEQHAWTNVSAFIARVTASELFDFKTYSIWALGDALEGRSSQAGQWFTAPELTQLELHLTVAAAWIRIAGRYMYENGTDHEYLKDVQVSLEARENKLPWWRKSDVPMFSRTRWEFWRGRFGQEAVNDKLSAEVRELAAEAAATIDGFLK